MRLRWCVGFPHPAPGSIVATVRPLRNPLLEPARFLSSALMDPPLSRQETLESAQTSAQPRIVSDVRRTGVSGSKAGFKAPHEATSKRPSKGGWAVMVSCFIVMLAAVLVAWWLARGGRLPMG
jgi:hypothetical protein